MLIAAIIVTITDSRILFVLTASCRFVLIIKRFSPANSAFSASMRNAQNISLKSYPHVFEDVNEL